MSNKPITPRFKRPGYTADTDVEIDGSGAIDPLMPAPQRKLTKLGAYVAFNAKLYCDTAFDPKREDEYLESQEALEAVGDTVIGATSELEETSLPNNAKYVPGAADNLLEHRQTFTEKCPVAAAAVDWEGLSEARVPSLPT